MHEISRRIRGHLDPEEVIREAVDEVQRLLGPRRTSMWITTGADDPKRVRSSGRMEGPPTTDPLPELVVWAARKAKTRSIASVVAAPVIAPRSGVLGVLCIEDDAIDPATRTVIEDVAGEVGYALETASLYEQAVAGKERSEAILSRVADAIVVTDARGRILETNQRADALVGATASHARGGLCAAVLGLHEGERALDCAEGCQLLRGSVADHGLGTEVWRAGPDGRRQPLLANVSAVTDKTGAIAEVVHSLRDITRLKEADEAKTMFLATASHELKTPLTVIRGFAQLLSNGRSIEAQDREQALVAIDRRAQQLDGIIERLLLSSRIEAGRAELRIAEIDVEPIVRYDVEEIARATGRSIEFDVGPTPLPQATGDRDAVRTILQHLVENAIKYTPNRGTVGVGLVADAQNVALEVRDGGIGMDAEQAAHCFDKFWQAESSDIRRFGGTGIGLYIVRSLAEAMDGSVAVESAPGQGSTFTVCFPRADVERPVPTAGPPEERGVEPSVIREFMRQIGIPQKG